VNRPDIKAFPARPKRDVLVVLSGMPVLAPVGPARVARYWRIAPDLRLLAV